MEEGLTVSYSNLFEYDLYLRPDYEGSESNQWFYFRVWHMIPNKVYKFNIVNMSKRHSLFAKGLRPLLYSEKDARNGN